jgi:predicted dehydrogenase
LEDEMTGVVGVGHLGYHHARILGTLSGEPVPVYDPRPERAAQVASELPVLVTGSLGQLLDLCGNVVVACTTSAHFEVVMTALEAGCNVLVEKPIAAVPEQAEVMVAKAAGLGLVLAVGHVERFNPAILAAAGLISDPLFVEGHRMAPFKPRGTDVSVVMDLMIHDIDLVLSFVRSPVVSVHAAGVPVLSDQVDIASARISFENGCVANMTASRISRDQMRKLRFFQRRSYVSVDFAGRSVEAYRVEPGGMILPVPVAVADGDALTAELMDFLAACSGTGRPTVTGEDGLVALRSAQRISAAIEEAAGALRASRDR